MKKISICDFAREYVYAGHYKVTYTITNDGQKVARIGNVYANDRCNI